MILKDNFKALFRGGFSLAISKYILDLGTSLSVDTKIYYEHQGNTYDFYTPLYLFLT
jgi:hypothetical protein